MRLLKRVDAAQALLLTRRGELLLIKRTLDYPLVPGGPWSLFGGKIERGETPRRAAEREILEEIGLARPRALDYYASRSYRIPGKQHGVKHVFAFSIGRDLSRLRLGEGAGFALFMREELASLRLNPYDRPDIAAFLGEYHG